MNSCILANYESQLTKFYILLIDIMSNIKKPENYKHRVGTGAAGEQSCFSMLSDGIRS